MNEAQTRVPDPRPVPRWHVASMLALLATAICGLWLRPVNSSLWLDEAVTWWMVKDGWAEMLRRSSEYSGGNPFYYIIIYGCTKLFGASELTLRLPSLLAMGAAVLYLMRLARRWFDLRTCLCVGIAFAANPLVQFEARNARTYALGLAFFVGACFHLVRLLETSRWRHAVAFGILASCVFHTHFVLVPAYAICAGIVLAWWARERRLPWKQLGGALASLCVAMVPSIPYFLALYGRKASLVVVPSPFIEELIKYIVPQVSAFSALGLLLLGAALGMRLDPERPRPHWAVYILLGFWCFFPPFLIYAISKLTSVSLFIPRYFSYYIPGIALAIGLGARSFRSDGFRTFMGAVFVIVALAGFSMRRHHIHDWKGVAVEVKKAALETDGTLEVLLHSGLIEAKDEEWWGSPDRSAYLNACFSLYDLPANCTLRALPQSIANKGAKAYMEQILTETAAKGRLFLMVTRMSDPGLVGFMEGVLWRQGWRAEAVNVKLGNLVVYRCAREGG